METLSFVLRLLGLLRLGDEGEYPLLTIDRRNAAPLGDDGGDVPPLVSSADEATSTIAARVLGADSITMLAICDT